MRKYGGKINWKASCKASISLRLRSEGEILTANTNTDSIGRVGYGWAVVLRAYMKSQRGEGGDKHNDGWSIHSEGITKSRDYNVEVSLSPAGDKI